MSSRTKFQFLQIRRGDPEWPVLTWRRRWRVKLQFKSTVTKSHSLQSCGQLGFSDRRRRLRLQCKFVSESQQLSKLLPGHRHKSIRIRELTKLSRIDDPDRLVVHWDRNICRRRDRWLGIGERSQH